MKTKVIKIGVIGPRSYNIGGHDNDNPVRENIRVEIRQLVKNHTKDDTALLGITSLALGAEQDFAKICCDANIDYMVYTPYEDQESKWSSLPNAVEEYKLLYKNAISRISLGDGGYSPKKILLKNKKIVKDADIIIFVENPLKRVYSELITMAKLLGKGVYVVVPGKN